jgi:imidazolonepropionase-like amidohydrolase
MLSTQQLRILIAHGVTPFREISRNGLRLKRLVNEGFIPRRRIAACGPGLSRTGGHGDAHNLLAQRCEESAIRRALDDTRLEVDELPRPAPMGADMLNQCVE